MTIKALKVKLKYAEAEVEHAETLLRGLESRLQDARDAARAANLHRRQIQTELDLAMHPRCTMVCYDKGERWGPTRSVEVVIIRKTPTGRLVVREPGYEPTYTFTLHKGVFTHAQGSAYDVRKLSGVPEEFCK